MDEQLDRRTWVARVGTVVVGSAALAGCSGPGEGEDEEDGGDGGGEGEED
jgi:hypothetical protein